MELESIYAVIITLITVLGSAGAWRYYEKRADQKQREENEYRLDCRERISKLELLLEQSAKEKDEMRNTILKLTEEVAYLRSKVEHLEQINSK